MKANCWEGKQKLRVENVPDPEILNSRDAIVRITSTAICGSDLHLYNGFIPTMESGDILGHEFMGEVVEVGRDVKNLKVGDRVVVPFPIACGNCGTCQRDLFSLCENSNPNAWMAEKLWGHCPAGLFGYSHMLGGFAGGQAEYARVPFADVGPLKVPDGMTDEQVLFLSDIFPTGYMGAEMCDIKPGDVDRGLGLRARSASSPSPAPSCSAPSGSSPSIASPIGCSMAQRARQASETHQLRGDRRPRGADGADRRARTGRVHRRRRHGGARPAPMLRLRPGQAGDDAGDRSAARAARGDPVLPQRRDRVGDRRLRRVHRQVPDGRGGEPRRSRSSGQCHVQRYMQAAARAHRNGEIDPSFVITHRLPLDEAPEGFDMFLNKQDNCEKVVLRN